MRFIISAIVIIGLSACSFPGATIEDGPGLVGTYVVNGVDPGGYEYSGTVVIIGTDDADRVEIEWIVTGAVQTGTGVISGDTLDVEWSTLSGSQADASGTATYTITSDGRLVGTRTVSGADVVGTEEIFPES
ncbi:MAG: hypothetical protein KJP12_00640 [Acidimicrobiia bacterium]|nr:hypothetical protein [Acidimicrobiia bacterium]MBT8213702.1 hypothetical protein [Acidimicrobiia bacterium]NNF69859.1 hypothetical protein [Acidimicrobiia bacterium]